jgi:pimeloyl-ACP methyl ester carboxylesterase
MPRFQHGEFDLAYLDQGAGEPIVLIHGFASTKEVNWVNPGWVATLQRAKRRVVALDLRGHGESSKHYDPAVYDTRVMADDVCALLDHLGIPRADVMGYSMGARVTAFFAWKYPERARTAIIAGLGYRLIEGVGLPVEIADALEASSLEAVEDPIGRMFRAFAEQNNSDLRALAACMRGSRQTMTLEEAASLRVPVLIAVGTKDNIAGSAEELAAVIPAAKVLEIAGRDHMLAVGDKVFKDGVLAFLQKRP